MNVPNENTPVIKEQNDRDPFLPLGESPNEELPTGEDAHSKWLRWAMQSPYVINVYDNGETEWIFPDNEESTRDAKNIMNTDIRVDEENRENLSTVNSSSPLLGSDQESSEVYYFAVATTTIK